MANAYNKVMKARTFVNGQMVLKAADHVRRNLSTPSKFPPNWVGPYLVREANESGYYCLATADGEVLAELVNGKWLKLYYALPPILVLCGLFHSFVRSQLLLNRSKHRLCHNHACFLWKVLSFSFKKKEHKCSLEIYIYMHIWMHIHKYVYKYMHMYIYVWIYRQTLYFFLPRFFFFQKKKKGHNGYS